MGTMRKRFFATLPDSLASELPPCLRILRGAEQRAQTLRANDGAAQTNNTHTMNKHTLPQIGVITYGGGINVRHFIANETAKGRVVIFRDGHATVHAAK